MKKIRIEVRFFDNSMSLETVDMHRNVYIEEFFNTNKTFKFENVEDLHNLQQVFDMQDIVLHCLATMTDEFNESVFKNFQQFKSCLFLTVDENEYFNFFKFLQLETEERKNMCKLFFCECNIFTNHEYMIKFHYENLLSLLNSHDIHDEKRLANEIFEISEFVNRDK